MSALPSWLPWQEWGWTEAAALSIIPITYALYRYFFATMIQWKRNGIPYVPVRPFVGSISDAAFVRKPIGQVYADIYKREKRKRYVGFYRFMQPAILLRDPELIRKVIVTDFEYFPSNEVKGDTEVDPMFGRHLFALSGEPWAKLRSSVGQGFTDEKLQEIFNLLPEVCDILKTHTDRKIAGNAGKWEVDLMELSTNFTTTAMSSCALGNLSDAINNPDTDLRKMVRLLVDPTPKKVVSQLIFLQVPWLAKKLRIPFVPSKVREYFRKVVPEEVARRKEGGVQRNDYMQMLIGLWDVGKLSLATNTETPGKKMEKGAGGGEKPSQDPKKTKETKKEAKKETKKEGKGDGDEPIQDPKGTKKETAAKKAGDGAGEADDEDKKMQDKLDDITAVALAFVSDGTVTTATVLSFTLFELAHHQEIQEKVRKEITEVLGRHKGKITYAALKEMIYLDAVMLEALRFYPPAPFMVRSCSKPYKLPNPYTNKDDGGILLNEGFPLVVSMYGIHMDDTYYANAKRFDPNRFSREEITARKEFTYYPYGEGPRICPGFRLGLLMAKSAMAHILPSIEVFPSQKTQKPITLDPRYFITVSKGGLWAQMRKIKNLSLQP